MEERKPWERQLGEHAKAYAAFCIYRDMSPQERSLRKAAQTYYEDAKRTYIGHIQNWCVKHNWVKRCEAYDDFMDEQKRQADLDALLDMSIRQSDLGKRMQDLGDEGLEELMKKSPHGFNTLDIVRLTRTGAEIERLARGVPTSIVEEQGKIERDFIIINPPAEAKETEENPFEEGG